MTLIRKPAVAGMFYPAKKEKLRELITELLESSKGDEKIENIFGIIAPHAGYLYSGKTAAAAYNLISGTIYKTVVVISPSHREYFPGASIYNGDFYQTPLGDIPIDKELSAKILDGSKFIFEGAEGHRQEHALEVQLPFLQTVLGDFSLVPMVMGNQGAKFIDDIAQQISKVVNEDFLIVASSDLSHFHSKEEAVRLDSIIVDKINAFDYDGLMTAIDRKNCEACGGGPIIAMMKTAAMKNRKHSRVVARCDSGDVTGDSSEVVGYLSAVIY
ncbi:MAG: AmmeMemoRadiSam system protein B [bacterium]